MEKLLLIDGNSIMNRAFYGIMGSKMLMTEDGTYTNAVYGFLAILFKELEELKPEYICVAFDLKAPTERHQLYKEYKANRKGMPNELAQQMPIIKNILHKMNIQIIEKEGYEADDILGTLAKWGQSQNLEVIILTGDRDSFQLIDENIIVRIPRTKQGRTETEDYNIQKIKEEYGLMPKDLIEVKGLAGDASDNIPGVPGVGEKTALKLVQEYGTIENIYLKIDSQKGKLKENLEQNKDLAMLSRTLGIINIEVPIEKEIKNFKVIDWNKEEVYEIFKKLKFNRYIERFNLSLKEQPKQELQLEYTEINENKLKDIISSIQNSKKMYYYLECINQDKCIVDRNIKEINIYLPNDKKSYYTKDIEAFKTIFEDENILKIGYKQKEDWILLKNSGINAKNLMFDIEIAGYILNSNISKYTIEYLAETYLGFNLQDYLANSDAPKTREVQMSLFAPQGEETKSIKSGLYVYLICELYNGLLKKLEESDALELFNNIEMPLVEVLASMQYEGIYIDKQELIDFGKELKEKLDILTKEIYELAEQEFNINSTKQLGEILFEKLKLPIIKKTKTGYSTDSDALEKLRTAHPIIEKVLEYRQIVKLNSTYVDGLIPYINEKTNRIHSYFHQTVTATGRISSTEPNLQNIPTRFELGRNLRKVFKPQNNNVFIDADYSQIELRILADISKDENMIKAFLNNEDIHARAAAEVLGKPIGDVTKDERTHAKAVNFGIVYGISDFGLGEQLGISRKKAKEYIDQYLEKYSGIKQFMQDIVYKTKEKGYVETLYKRRRYVPELQSNNYMVRQFGSRVAMNTPIQGTAADIMKIAMINVYKKLKEQKLKSKLLLQVHDELLIEAVPEEIEQVKNILKNEMENVITLKVPLIAELSVGTNWLEAK